MRDISVAVIGGGRWARALALALAGTAQRRGTGIARVMQYRPPRDASHHASRHLKDVGTQRAQKPKAGEDATLQMTAAALLTAAGEAYAEPIELSELIEADLIILAVQARMVRPLMRAARRALRPDQMLVHAVGSFAPSEGDGGARLVSDVVQEETPLRRLGALAGPALAEDLEEHTQAALVCGSLSEEVSAAVERVMVSPTLRIYQSQDLVGVQVARATSCVVALASGVADSLGLGPSTRATLIGRGAAEMSKLALVLGGDDRTLLGTAGVGELVAATERRGSADFLLGQLLGRGTPLADAERQIGRVCDSLTMIEEGTHIARRFGLQAPMLNALQRWHAGRLPLDAAMAALLSERARA